MTERLSNARFNATPAHNHLYQKWAQTGAGLLITGNVIIDRKHLESAGNIVFDEQVNESLLKEWAQNAQANGNAAWVQISHAGRQTNRFSTSRPLAPSAVQLKKMGLFGTPKAMTEAQIEEVLHGFSNAAQIAQRVGFSGIQIHAAHGYLLSQFLSPITNQRTDQWGGSLENRSRLLRNIIKVTRHFVGPKFPISVKLNSADFQKGGFTQEESLEVVQMLDELEIDLLEISGGTYERLAF
ncbi:MAG: NADH:flavin oxidoreductase, partial [Bacteroidota bacterium]